METLINTDRFSGAMRRKVRHSDGHLLISRFSDSAQLADLSEPPNCESLGRIRHFRRQTSDGWPDNSLPIDPAVKALRSPHVDVLETQLFQNAACNWRCWYCYVPFDHLSGDERLGQWKTADELVALYSSLSSRPSVLVLSGGQPDLVPEWTYETMQALRERSLDETVYLWTDDNLSNDYLWRFLSPEQIASMAAYKNYGRVGCFKGFDAKSFSFNTGAAPAMFERQFTTFERLLATGMDVYAYATFTSDCTDGVDEKICGFVDRLQAISRMLPLRLIPLEIQPFTPTLDRLDERTAAMADEIQQLAVRAWNCEIERRFTENERLMSICDVAL
ncbi:MAG TPA: radical SAM protein [Candidatus Acidoferrales bacterium]|nr:radical SAM protein [Candidatus Acidoferrales bacterium]